MEILDAFERLGEEFYAATKTVADFISVDPVTFKIVLPHLHRNEWNQNFFIAGLGDYQIIPDHAYKGEEPFMRCGIYSRMVEWECDVA